MSEYLTIAEAARFLRRSTWLVHLAVQSGDLPAFRPGGRGATLIRAADLQAYVEQARVSA